MGFPRAERVLAGFSCALALTVSSGTLAAQPAGAASIYCCDVGGQPVCGDILPAACYGRAYREMSPSGIVRRTVPAPLTADELSRLVDLLGVHLPPLAEPRFAAGGRRQDGGKSQLLTKRQIFRLDETALPMY